MLFFIDTKCEKFAIANGLFRFGHLTINTKVNISCKDGYHLRGPSVVTCRADGSWTPALPTCERGKAIYIRCMMIILFKMLECQEILQISRLLRIYLKTGMCIKGPFALSSRPMPASSLLTQCLH